MRSGSVLVLVLAAALAAVSLASGQSRSPLGPPPNIKPPKIAVVSIAEVFESYEKKKDIEKKLEAEVKEAEKSFQDDQIRFKRLQEEVKNLAEGSDEHKRITLEIRKMQYELESRQKDLVRQFQEKQFEALKEIRKEITDDIETYARSIDVDMVLEKQMAVEGKGSAIHWPIVHYVKGELEITKDIVERLNLQYGKPAPKAAPPAPTAPGGSAKKTAAAPAAPASSKNAPAGAPAPGSSGQR